MIGRAGGDDHTVDFLTKSRTGPIDALGRRLRPMCQQVIF